MSFVGPRPLVPEEIEWTPVARLRSRPSPATTRAIACAGPPGLAQIYADRTLRRRDKFRYDLLYIRRRSFGLDLRLIALSCWIIVRGAWERRGAKL
jgi:lipopolysaccharide/colanic/teichoic acid biosynthesis glycosyltransferase